jgi:hypothetical protein
MGTRRLGRSEWRSFCDRLSRKLRDETAELEVVALALGDRVEARWVPLYGISYDARADLFEIALKGVDHPIASPRDVVIEETPRGIVSVAITTADERQEILKLREPLTLPGEPPAEEEA